MSKKYGYIRVSTIRQQESERTQKEKLLEAGVLNDDIYIERVSGKDITNRPVLKALIEILKENDSLYIYRFDRLGRNCKDVISVIEDLVKKGVNVIDINLKLDYKSTSGKLVMQMLAAISEMERNMILERVNEGLAKAKERGVKLGRKPGFYKINPELVKKEYEFNKNIASIARKFGVDRNTVVRYLKDIFKMKKVATYYQET